MLSSPNRQEAILVKDGVSVRAEQRRRLDSRGETGAAHARTFDAPIHPMPVLFVKQDSLCRMLDVVVVERHIILAAAAVLVTAHKITESEANRCIAVTISRVRPSADCDDHGR